MRRLVFPIFAFACSWWACDEQFPVESVTSPAPPIADGGVDADADGASSADACARPPGLISLEPAFGGATFTSPVELQQAGGKFYVIEQAGRVKVIEPPGTALDISTKLASGGEAGLLGLAFDPQFAVNRYVYLHFTAALDAPVTGVVFRSNVARFTMSGDGLTIDPASEKTLLVVDQPFSNHNGGKIAFGPDGMLYVALGDGGSGGDPNGYGQNTNELLGKILRIDPNGGDPYAIPSDNPFAASGGRPEIYAYGFRNPWRFSFDRLNGKLWVGDVGQGAFEEVDVVVKGGNYGWNTREGAHCYQAQTCATAGLIDPVVEYGHVDGAVSITGGYVYGGARVPSLTGKFIYGDFGNGHIWAADESNAGADAKSLLILASGMRISTFGQDADGEVYVADYSAGRFFRIAPPAATSDAGCP